MNKKLIALLLSAALFVVTALPVNAEEPSIGKFFLKNIVINGTEINNYNLNYPFVLYSDTTYLPLTAELGEICGFSAELDQANNLLKLREKTPSTSNLKENLTKNEGANIPITTISNTVVLKMNDQNSTFTSGGIMDTGGKPILIKDGVPYLPLRAFTGESGFGWSLYYDQYYGICISTKSQVPATTYFSPEQAKYYEGLTDYILKRNKNVRPTLAQDYAHLFERASEVNRIDINVLMAMAQSESNFNFNAKNNSGATGMMQIMPKTAESLGLTAEQLYDARLNIFYGAMYLRRQLDKFDDNLGLAISAYSKGSGAVSRGAYSRAYVEKISNTAGTIDQHVDGFTAKPTK